MQTIEYDDSQLQQMFAALDPRKRVQALKGGFRREANQVRKTAINNLRSSLASNKDLEKGVRAIVFRRAAGFRITVGARKANSKTGKGEQGMHLNRRGEKKPILIWAEEGTAERRTEAGGGRRRYTRKRAPHSTGRMKRYGFMAQTLSQVRDTVTDDIHRMVSENIVKVAQRYGCK